MKYLATLNPGSAKHEFIGKDKAADIFNLNEKLEGSKGTLKDLLLSRNEMLCAGYCVYSSACELVFTFKDQGVLSLDTLLG
jgi:fructose-1,6-bisphosphatase